MFAFLKKWYQGRPRMRRYENDPESSFYIMPVPYTEYHWTAKIVRPMITGFCGSVIFVCNNWKFFVTTIVAIVGVVIAWLTYLENGRAL